MSMLFPVLVLCCASDGTPDREELTRFKQSIRHIDAMMSWLYFKNNRDAIGVVPRQHKDLQAIEERFRRKIARIKREMRKKYPYPEDPKTGQIIGIEACRAHDRYLEAVGRASAPVEEAWRKEIYKILAPAQIARMNEIYWKRVGASLLFDEDFHRVLKLSKEQRAALKALYSWSIESPGPGLLGDTHPAMIAKKIEAEKKALAVLTKEQRKAFEFLLGVK